MFFITFIVIFFIFFISCNCFVSGGEDRRAVEQLTRATQAECLKVARAALRVLVRPAAPTSESDVFCATRAAALAGVGRAERCPLAVGQA